MLIISSLITYLFKFVEKILMVTKREWNKEEPSMITMADLVDN